MRTSLAVPRAVSARMDRSFISCNRKYAKHGVPCAPGVSLSDQSIKSVESIPDRSTQLTQQHFVGKVSFPRIGWDVRRPDSFQDQLVTLCLTPRLSSFLSSRCDGHATHEDQAGLRVPAWDQPPGPLSAHHHRPPCTEGCKQVCDWLTWLCWCQDWESSHGSAVTYSVRDDDAQIHTSLYKIAHTGFRGRDCVSWSDILGLGLGLVRCAPLPLTCVNTAYYRYLDATVHQCMLWCLVHLSSQL